jgi:nucleoside-diphosphate-sugar epimerase
LAALVERAADRKVRLEHVDRRDIDNIRRRVLSIEKARRMLRWVPQVTLEAGLLRTAQWHAEFVARSSLPAVATLDS